MARKRSHIIAIVWSFTDDMAPVPYVIERHGISRTEGGSGVTWTCSCPFYTRRIITCKHLRTFFASVQRGILDQRYSLSVEGTELLQPVLALARERHGKDVP